MREVVRPLARRLSARAPHLLWLAVACRDATTEVAIAAWSPGRSGPRVSALLVDRTHVVDSDAETLCALAAGNGVRRCAHARALGRRARPRGGDAPLLPNARATRRRARGRSDAGAHRQKFGATSRCSTRRGCSSCRSSRRRSGSTATARSSPGATTHAWAAAAASSGECSCRCSSARSTRRVRSRAPTRARARPHSVSERRTVRAVAARAGAPRPRVPRRRARSVPVGPARPLPLHGARGERGLVRGGGRSRDARTRVRVADGRRTSGGTPARSSRRTSSSRASPTKRWRTRSGSRSTSSRARHARPNAGVERSTRSRRRPAARADSPARPGVRLRRVSRSRARAHRRACSRHSATRARLPDLRRAVLTRLDLRRRHQPDGRVALPASALALAS